ncbi:MAG: TRAP transporter permease DctM/Q [Gammaproteobacteria bacterium]|nr:MAG: TRAP transporter permease DctM/Q [Gammaproteobacteria bacterium]
MNFDSFLKKLKSFYIWSLVLLGISWIFDLPVRLNIGVVTASYISVMLAIAIAAGFLLKPLSDDLKPSIIDLVMGFLAIICWGWASLNYVDWLTDLANRGIEKWIPGVIAILLLIEALRRYCGYAITILTIIFIVYGFFGHNLPGIMQGAQVNPTRLVLYFYADTGGVPGLILSIVCSVVFGFLLMGELLKVSGAGQFLTDLSLSLMGHYRGGPAKVSIVASSIFGSISGSTVGNVMSTGVVSIPLMKKTGLPGYFAAAVEAIASNGGQLAPPVMGATAFLIAEFLDIPYVEVVAAAALPAIIYYVILFAQVDLMAKDNNLKGIDRSKLPDFKFLLSKRGLHLFPIVLLIFLMFGIGLQPAKSALISGFAAVICGFFMSDSNINHKDINPFMQSVSQTLIPIILIGGAAGIIVGVLNVTGLGFNLTLGLTDIGNQYGLLVMLFLTGIVAIILGMGMPTAAVYIVLSVVLAPAVIEMGVPVLAAHLFIFYFGLLSMITPPVAVASFVAAGIAGSSLWKTSFTAIKLGIAAYLLPFLFVYNDSLLFKGSWVEILNIFFTCLISGLILSHVLRGNSIKSLKEIIIIGLYLFSSLLIGSSTLWLGRDSNYIYMMMVFGILVLYSITRISTLKSSEKFYG